MPGCEYCEMFERGDVNNLLAKNEHAVAVVYDFFREGHCTVILKKHKKSVSEMDAVEYNSVFELIKKVARALEKKYDCEKTYLLSIGDMCEHLHFHLIPKHKDKCSMGRYCFEKVAEAEGERNPSDSELSTLAGEIKSIIDGMSP